MTKQKYIKVLKKGFFLGVLLMFVLPFYNGAVSRAAESLDDTEIHLVGIHAVKGKTQYYVGDILSYSDITVTATYSDGTTEDVTWAASFDDDEIDMDEAGNYVLYVRYEGFQAEIKIAVVKKIPVFNPPKKIVLDKKSSGSYYYDDTDLKIVSLKSSNKKVANPKPYSIYSGETCIYIESKRTGKAVVTLRDSYNREWKIKVVVKDSYFRQQVRDSLYARLSYGSKKLEGYCLKNSKVTVRIGKKTYKRKVGKSGKFTIKVKKLYKLKTKIHLTAKHGKYKVREKREVYSATSGYRDGCIWSCRNYIPCTFRNLTKGDVVKVSAGGQTSKWKVSSNIESTFRYIYFKNALGRIPSIHIKIKNKFGQVLHDWTTKLRWRR